MSKTTLTLPAGKYYIGDPCYVISDRDAWIEFIESCGYFEASCEAYIGEDKFWASETAYGDGGYWCSRGKELSVDSGLIGIVPFSVVEKYCENIEDLNDLGLAVEFNNEIGVTFDPEADVTHIFGDVYVYADNDEYENEEYEYENEDEEEECEEDQE
jgi:hypothetical protein